MTTQWPTRKLKDVCSRITVGHVGPMADQYRERGIPFLRSLNIAPFYIEGRDLKFIDQRFHEKLRKSKLRPGDVGVVRTGYPGTACVIPEALGEANCSDLVVITPGSELNAHFLVAIFNSTFGKNLVGGRLVGAAQQHFNVTVAKELKLQLPPRAVQDKIVAILLAYNDLIETNKRRIGLLENLAEEVYREWFVRMRFPGHEHVKFAKGVPEGWPFDLGSTFFNHVKGKSYSSPDISDEEGECFFITLKSFHRRGGYRKEGLKYYSGPYKEDQCVDAGDVVMAVTDMTQDRAVVGEVARIPRLSGKKAVISLDVIRLIPKDMSTTFLYAHMRHSGFANFIKEFANGANVLHLKPDVVGQQRLLFPPKGLRQQFSDLADPIYWKIGALEEANAALTETRALLLPRLISGKLSVADLDIQSPPSMQEEIAEPAYA